MEIILKEDIVNLGYKNDIVTVKSGYGRNYLIPTGKAVIASPGFLIIIKSFLMLLQQLLRKEFLQKLLCGVSREPCSYQLPSQPL